MLSTKIFLSSKSWAQKFCKLESHRLNSKLEYKKSDLVHADPNHTKSNQPIPAYFPNIGSIHDSSYISAIEKILAMTVHYLVHASPIFTYGRASDPPSPSHDSSEESVPPKGNPKLCNNPINPVLYVSADPELDPSLKYSSSLYSSDSSYNKYYKQRGLAKKLQQETPE